MTKKYELIKDGNLTIPINYKNPLGILETEKAIKLIKDNFERMLASNLNLTRVSAPLFVKTGTGINDDLNGIERSVKFDMLDTRYELEIVQSLAKWKRIALGKYGFKSSEGIYTDMNAIRRDEELDNMHSIYVDQWDWEKVIESHDRNEDTLRLIVNKIYDSFKKTAKLVEEHYPDIKHDLPESISFITTEELLQMYPNLTSKEREHQIAREKKAVFIMKIGDLLSDGKAHDGRAADYDDWNLNGDIVLYYPVLDIGFELSSMGIRVNKESLMAQIKKRNQEHKLVMDYHKMILDDKLPLTIGGGIGQSRICMYLLNKAHIGEVQASIWADETIEKCFENNMLLL
ncbi:MAG: aspartate--ammonia ligase [Filifactoraceae bacterium]